MTSSHQTADTRAKEFDLRYYDWRVLLAACLGVMAGFGSLFAYIFPIFWAKSWALHT